MQELKNLIAKLVALMKARDPQTASESVPSGTLTKMRNEVDSELERLAPILGKRHHIPKH